MTAIKPYRAAAHKTRGLHGPQMPAGMDVTMHSHVVFNITGHSHVRGAAPSIDVDSIEPFCADARALRAANRSRSRSPLRSPRRQPCTMHADRRARPSEARGPRKLKMAEPATCSELKQHELEVQAMKMDLLQVLESALESGCVVMVDSFEKPGWKAYENTTVMTVAPKTTRWAALGKLVRFVCASLRRARPSSSTSLHSSTSSSKTQFRV